MNIGLRPSAYVPVLLRQLRARFVDGLRLERDPTMRVSLQRLLFEELEKLSFNFEQLGNVERHVAEGMRRIDIQKPAIESQKRSDHGVGLDQNTLGNLVEAQRVFERRRHATIDHIDRNGSIGKTSFPRE